MATIQLYEKILYICEEQQGLEIHGLEDCGPWRYMVLIGSINTLDTRILFKSLAETGFFKPLQNHVALH